MKTVFASAVFFPLVLLLALAGCSHIDLTPQPSGYKVLTGTIVFDPSLILPADAIITVRLLDSRRDNLPLGEQTIKQPGKSPVAFQIDYRAEDIQPPHDARLDVRIAYGGRLRLTSSQRATTASLVSPRNAAQPFTLNVSGLSGATAP